jgi:hypothetical protein
LSENPGSLNFLNAVQGQLSVASEVRKSLQRKVKWKERVAGVAGVRFTGNMLVGMLEGSGPTGRREDKGFFWLWECFIFRVLLNMGMIIPVAVMEFLDQLSEMYHEPCS